MRSQRPIFLALKHFPKNPHMNSKANKDGWAEKSKVRFDSTKDRFAIKIC